ncbi:MAG: deoxynucleoside kinase [Anaerolineae bacterium]|nr:deoxynucleoside kinase [Anaerolineae bacterium]
MSKEHYYIAIEGPIGVGKTTLARLMQPEFEAQLVLEVFEENPFLTKFYIDREAYAFQTQIFFLLSRYRQHRDLASMLRQGNIISDYAFIKDWIFAHINLRGDELETYEQLYRILCQHVVSPDLIVYLDADVSVLMERITLRDRSYERNISPEYLEALRGAYETFFADYSESPVLRIDTNHLDIVHKPDDLDQVIQRVRSALRHGTHQPALPQFEPLSSVSGASAKTPRRLFSPYPQGEKETSTLLLHLVENTSSLLHSLIQLWVQHNTFAQEPDQALQKALGQLYQMRDQLTKTIEDLSLLGQCAGSDPFSSESTSPNKKA